MTIIKAFEQNPNVLAVFTGPHTYVSATWYDNPSQAKYMELYEVCIAKGTISFGNKEDLIAILKRLTLHYENNNRNLQRCLIIFLRLIRNHL
jgi:transcriptional regulator